MSDNSTLPEPLRKQLEEANKLHDAYLNGDTIPGTSDEEEAARVAAEQEAAEKERLAAEEAERKKAEEQAKGGDDGSGDDGDKLYAPPKADEVSELQEKLKQAEARYGSLRGKYDSEVPQLRAQLEALTKQHEQLMKLFEGAGPAAAADDDQAKADREQFGDDLVAMVDRQAKALLQRLGLSPEALKKLEDQLAEVRTVTSKVAMHAEQTDEQRMLEALHKALPEYAAIDADPRFGQWLQQPDEISGITRGILYEQAGMKEFNAVRVEKIMRQFVADLGLKLPSDVERQTAAGGDKKTDPREVHVQPRRGAAAPASPAGQKKTWSRGEITKYYSDVMRGKYTPEEAKRIEAEIFEAQRDGRVV